MTQRARRRSAVGLGGAGQPTRLFEEAFRACGRAGGAAGRIGDRHAAAPSGARRGSRARGAGSHPEARNRIPGYGGPVCIIIKQ